MQRAVWTAAEVLSNFQDDIESFELDMGGGGDFELTVDGQLAYSKREAGRYPELKEVMTLVAAAIDVRAAAAS